MREDPLARSRRRRAGASDARDRSDPAPIRRPSRFAWSACLRLPALLRFWLRLRCPPACAKVGPPARGVRHSARDAPPQGSTSMNHAQHAAAKGRRPLRPPLRARRVRRGHGGAAGQRADARGRHAGDHGAREPRAPRRLGRGPAHRRRRRDPDADARRAAAGGRRLRAAAARRLRRADVLPADRRRGARAAGGAARADRPAEGQRLLGWRDVPVCPRSTPARSRAPAAR